MKSKPSADVALNVKLSTEADSSTAVHNLERTPGVQEVVQTFPNESDAELSSLYMVKIHPLDLQPALRHIQQDPGIEYVEEVPSRKLIQGHSEGNYPSHARQTASARKSGPVSR